jgi:hypothetical protein
LATHQFINNDYESNYYRYHKGEAKADFKSAYLANELKQSNLFALQNFESKNDSVKKLVAAKLQILIDNLKDEPYKLGMEKSDLSKDLRPENYTKIRGGDIDAYLEDYKKYYQQIYNRNVDTIEKKMAYLESHGTNINEDKNKYYNESLADLVKNINVKQRLLEYNGKLIQQINPIFQDPKPSHIADYRTAFFLPVKNLFGIQISTFWFNMIVIWAMAFFYYIMLYFEWLRKLVETFGKVNISNKLTIPFKRK